MTMTEIVSAINSPCVFRLKQTFLGLSKKEKDDFEDMRSLVLDPQHNYQTYRDILNQLSMSSTPVVPYIGVLLSDMISLAELPNKDKEGLINFKKMRRISYTLDLITKLQTLPYTFEDKYAIKSFILHFPSNVQIMTQKELYRFSKRCETTAE
eukprot:TRINITY_DN9755_c0_g1_i1.p1 TRINITY_DN9755_c0_g1~~TRINITY_DN9755_c0_g1_i1.p1  ORF type:complete len:153 (-),score=8.25 TRINITY_DN9755_c0_g1_i1:33-491(-)